MIFKGYLLTFSLFARVSATLRSSNFTIGIDVFGQDTRFLRPWTTGAVFFRNLGFWHIGDNFDVYWYSLYVNMNPLGAMWLFHGQDSYLMEWNKTSLSHIRVLDCRFLCYWSQQRRSESNKNTYFELNILNLQYSAKWARIADFTHSFQNCETFNQITTPNDPV